ncbi:hypothetical protein ANI01nite_03820 [Glutamicibacter nicotianae]|uniref:Uncharacterized protein n=1 Tax=Glutamicibacter nicotianae TaxID=37929 RepID=A0ABQ0RH82_GLUNI|nr:hypothetical protein ANI01nite_03820 [Glutamicibacter nicotianae]
MAGRISWDAAIGAGGTVIPVLDVAVMAARCSATCATGPGSDPPSLSVPDFRPVISMPATSGISGTVTTSLPSSGRDSALKATVLDSALAGIASAAPGHANALLRPNAAAIASAPYGSRRLVPKTPRGIELLKP